ncbi:MAG: TetR family transcriptional regulator [Chloroflexota bacterium]
MAVSERAELPWWSKSRVLRQRTLSAERIVEAALALIDRDGLERLSMRRLGTDLSAGATSIYWHVPNKAALIDLIVDRLMEETAAELRVESGTTWRSQLASYALALRTVLERHSAAAPLLGGRQKGTRLRRTDRLLRRPGGHAGAEITDRYRRADCHGRPPAPTGNSPEGRAPWSLPERFRRRDRDRRAHRCRTVRVRAAAHA